MQQRESWTVRFPHSKFERVSVLAITEVQMQLPDRERTSDVDRVIKWGMISPRDIANVRHDQE